MMGEPEAWIKAREAMAQHGVQPASGYAGHPYYQGMGGSYAHSQYGMSHYVPQGYMDYGGSYGSGYSHGQSAPPPPPPPPPCHPHPPHPSQWNHPSNMPIESPYVTSQVYDNSLSYPVHHPHPSNSPSPRPSSSTISNPPPPPPPSSSSSMLSNTSAPSLSTCSTSSFPPPHVKYAKNPKDVAPIKFSLNLGKNSVNKPVPNGGPFGSQQQLPPLPPSVPPSSTTIPQDGSKQNIKTEAPKQPAPATKQVSGKPGAGVNNSSGGQGAKLVNPSLNAYVNKCFQRCTNSEERDDVESKLKAKFKQYTQFEIDNLDWTQQDLVSPTARQGTKPVLSVLSARMSTLPPVKDRLTDSIGDRNENRRPKVVSSSMKRRRRSRSSSSESSYDSRSYSSRSRSSSQDRRRNGRREDMFIPLSRGKKTKAYREKDVPIRAVNKQDRNKMGKKMKKQFGVEVDHVQIAKRKERFVGSSGKSSYPGVESLFSIDESIDLEDATPIVGTNKDLEKRYLRLTSAPDASTVRPIQILRRSIVSVLKKFKETDDYRYICDQLKAIRQDLTVQCIRNEFTVEVYETHARIALQKRDHEEFNQCQSQLRNLYTELAGCSNEPEFRAYYMLYNIFTENNSELQLLLRSLSQTDVTDERIAFSLKVRKAWSLGNYHALFRLYKIAPGNSSLIMNWFITRERKNSLKSLIKAVKPSLSIDYLTKYMQFSSRDECLAFLNGFMVKIVDGHLECKESQVVPVTQA